MTLAFNTEWHPEQHWLVSLWHVNVLHFLWVRDWILIQHSDERQPSNSSTRECGLLFWPSVSNSTCLSQSAWRQQVLRTRGNPSEFIYELIRSYKLGWIKGNLVVQMESNSLLLLIKQTFLQERRVYFVLDLLFIWMLLQTGMYNLFRVLCQHHHAPTLTYNLSGFVT